MPLSEHEQRMLDQIERDLYAQDPKFASAVRRGGGGGIRSAQGPRKLQAIALFVVGLVLLVAGIPLSTQSQLFLLVSLLGFLLMFGAGVLLLLGGKSRPAGETGESGSAERGAAPKKRATGKSFTTRMEERFRRRFE